MSTMIERVALAIFEQASIQSPGEGSDYAAADDGKTILDGAYDLRAVARAAIEAMREPTNGMALAASDECLEFDSYGNIGNLCEDSAKSVYGAMIDAALKEKAAP